MQLAMHQKPLSLSLSLSDEPSRESRKMGTSKQNCTRSTLPAAEEAQVQVAPQPWTPALAKKVSASTESSTLSSWVLHRPTACGLH